MPIVILGIVGSLNDFKTEAHLIYGMMEEELFVHFNLF